MFTTKVYNIILGSLSGILEEEFTAKEVIRIKNRQNAEQERKVFLNVDCNTNPGVLQKVDVVIGFVGN